MSVQTRRDPMHSVHAFAIGTAAALYALVLAGGFVTASDSGLGCGPQWPVCKAGLFPPVGDFHAWVEDTHRFLAFLVSLGVIGLWVMTRRAVSSGVRGAAPLMRLALVAVALILVEITLGMLVVLNRLPAGLVAVHMADATILLGLVISIALGAGQSRTSEATRAHRRATFQRWAFLAAASAVVTAALGSYVSHSTAADPCVGGFAGCLAALGHPAGAELWLVAVHVTAALGLGAILGLLSRASRPARGPLFWLAVIAYTAQVLIGMTLIWSGLTPAILWLHEAVGTLTAGLFIALFLTPTGVTLPEGSFVTAPNLPNRTWIRR